MRLYRNTAASRLRLDYGIELLAGLTFFDKTRSIAVALQPVQESLATAADATVAAERLLPALRATKRFAEYGTEQAVRVLHGRCKELDGARVGPITEALFPNDLSAEVTPKGDAQLAASKKLRRRIDDAGLAEIVAAKAELAAHLDAPLAAFDTASAALAGAIKTRSDAFLSEVARRNDHRRTIDAIFGELRAAYPGDRTIQKVIVPELDEGGSDDEAVTPVPTPT